MAIQEEIRTALQAAVGLSDQPIAVKERILAMLEAIYSGNELIEDQESLERHIETVLSAIELKPEEGTDEY